jgi:hypothetical protein
MKRELDIMEIILKSDKNVVENFTDGISVTRTVKE